ncbi:hypothetical protein [Kocuria turfanensis]|uniref:Two-component sensor histidine kinase n=1 Tax=Kocuria turfanensis TaxID=388357 RepID=A0A512IBR9_9MICC|nr:hypothetical protein [Kocuria turfanensis]GEO95144.1 hypothetical protein KTU01_12670 [Kocuria turfanensis]
MISRALFHPLTLVAAAVFFLIPVVLGVLQTQSMDKPELMQAALVTYVIAVALAVYPHGRRRLPDLPTALAVLLMLVSIQRSYDALDPQAELFGGQWFTLGFDGFIVVLGIRRRGGWGWATLVIAVAISMTWGARSAIGLWDAALSNAATAALLLASQLIAREYDRASIAFAEARDMVISARSHDEAEKDTVNASVQRVHEVRRLAGGLLERIAHDPSPVSDYEIEQFRLTEAQLRDSIRGRSVATPYLLEVTRAARARGVQVDILDERGKPLPTAVLRSATRRSMEVLNAATSGSVTIRAFPEGDPTAVFIVHDGNAGDEEPVAIEIADVTGEVSRF